MTVIIETILYEFFLHCAILGDVGDQLRDELRSLFLLSGTERKAFDLAISCKKARDIVTENDYKMYTRSKQYAVLAKRPTEYSAEEEEIISIKGRAIKDASKAGLFRSQSDTSLYTWQRLIAKAESGNIIALRVLGIASAIGGPQGDEIDGVGYLEKAARWGDPVGAMAFLYSTYRHGEDTNGVIPILNGAVKGTPYEVFAKRLCKSYEVYLKEENDGMRLLKKAFAEGKADSGCYDSLRAKIVYSAILPMRDKRYLMEMRDEELYGAVGKLPLSIPTSGTRLAKTEFKNFVLQREKEQNELSAWLDYTNLRASEKYRPLCLVTDNDFMAEYYGAEFKRVIWGNVETIEVADLKDHDFEPTDNNVFLRNLSDEYDNVLIFHMKGLIDETHLENVRNFLKSGQRKKFHLNKPSVTLDLGNVLPICICDKENAIKLRALVDEVPIANVTKEEKPVVFREIVKRKSELYHVKGDINEVGISVLSSVPLETAERVIEKAVWAHRFSREGFVLTEEVLSSYIDDKRNTNRSYGFGGNI